MAAVVVLLDVLCFWVVVSATDASFDPARRLRGAMVNSSQMQATAMAAEELDLGSARRRGSGRRRRSEDNPCDYEDCANGPLLEYQCCFAGCGCSVSIGCGSSDLPDYCGSLGATPGLNVTEPEQAAADEPLLAGATAVYCNPTLTDPPQFCPGGVACPNCGSDSCACPTGPSPPSPTPPPTGCMWYTKNYAEGTDHECRCDDYCDDFCDDQPNGCARTCRILNGVFQHVSSGHDSTCNWYAHYVTNPVDYQGYDCQWMAGTGEDGHGDNCQEWNDGAWKCREGNQNQNNCHF
jgi:hypothetical protein